MLGNRLKKCIVVVLLVITLFLPFVQTSVYAETLYLHQDHQGSTILVTDENGSVVGKKGYYPYGEVSDETGDTDVERLYTSQVSDADQTGLYYYNQRYYNPTLSKFIQPDPIKDGLNGYAYVSNNPINKVDPSGLMDVADDGGGIGSGGPLFDDDGPVGTEWSDPCTTVPARAYQDCRNSITFAAIYGESRDAVPMDFVKIGLTLFLVPAAGAVMMESGPILTTIATKCMLSSLCTSVLAALDLIDTTVDTASCISGNQDSCAYIVNPIPGAGISGLADDAEYLLRTFRIGQEDLYYGGAELMNNLTDEWIIKAKATSDSDLDFLTAINQAAFEEIEYDLKFTELIRSDFMEPSLLWNSNNFYAMCKKGVCSQKAQFAFNALDKVGYDADLVLVNFGDSTHLVTRVNLNGKFYFLDPTWNFMSEGFRGVLNIYNNAGLEVKSTTFYK